MSPRPDLSRRDLLKKAGVLALGALGLEASRAAAAESAAAGERTLAIFGTNWHHWASSEDPRDLNAHGRRLTLSGVLLSAEGDQLGVFRGTSHFIDGAFAGGAEDASVELHTFTLADGTIAGLGVCTGDDSTFTIIGGTGAYADARGTYLSRQSPIELGGDGSAEFSFRLTASTGGRKG